MNFAMIIFFLCSAAFAEPRSWKASSDPKRLVQSWNIDHLETKLGQLPLSGAVPSLKTPWPSSYLPAQRNGLLYRATYFQANQVDRLSSAVGEQFYSQFFNTSRPGSEAEAKKLTQTELDQLSPLEKFSILKNDYQYKIIDLFSKNSPSDPYWAGFCDAWASASVQYQEPSPKTLSIRKIKIHFTSADIKALLIANQQLELQTEIRPGEFIQLGSRCMKQIAVPKAVVLGGIPHFAETSDTRGLLNQDLKAYLEKYITQRRDAGLSELPANFVEDTLLAAKSPTCSDTNAGAFHLAIANQIGIYHKAILFDIARDAEIWNQPAFKYESKIEEVIHPKLAAGVFRQVKVVTQLSYSDDTLYGFSFSDETLASNTNKGVLSKRFKAEYAEYESLLVNRGERAHPGNYPDDLIESIRYEYILDLDQQDQIIGGEWLTYDRPDFLWVMKERGINAQMTGLEKLLR